MKHIDKLMLSVIGVLFALVTVANLLQPNRPTTSELEQRPLADIPAFSVEALASGDYFADWATFFSDTFLGRDALVSLSNRVDKLMGVPYGVGGGGQFAVLQGNTQKTDGPSEDDAARLEDLLAQLGTTVPETEVAETEPSETEGTDTEPFETETLVVTEETEPIPIIPTLSLSHDRLQLTVGSGAVVRATVTPSDAEHPPITWSVSDESLLLIMVNDNNEANIKGIAPGECVLHCDMGEERVSITVTVMALTGTETPSEDATADFLTNGMFIYGEGVYIPAYYAEGSAKYFAQTVAYYKALFGDAVDVSVIMPPVSSMVIDDEAVKSHITDQGEIQAKVGAMMDSKVNYINAYEALYPHRDEYIFYRSDHHWTAKGAYYAYEAFAASRGFTPTPLEDMRYTVINEEYYGSLYRMTQDERVKSFTDVIEAWVSKKELTMTVTTSYGPINTYDSCIVKGYTSYMTFIAGDNPLTVINVPENPQDRNILVMKDSFGDAFVPYLCEHYGNIIVVDVRHTDINVYEQFKDYGLTEILFVNNVQSALNTAWSNMYLRAVGVETIN